MLELTGNSGNWGICKNQRDTSWLLFNSDEQNWYVRGPRRIWHLLATIHSIQPANIETTAIMLSPMHSKVAEVHIS